MPKPPKTKSSTLAPRESATLENTMSRTLAARWLLALTAGVGAVLFLLWARGGYSQSGQPAPQATGVVSLLFEFGVTDAQPRRWDGSFTRNGGKLSGIRLWRPRKGDAVRPDGTWRLESRQGSPFKRRAWEPEPPVPVAPFVESSGLVADFSESVQTIDVATPHGRFTVTPASIESGRPLRVLNGSVRVNRVPFSVRLSAPDFENDFATVAQGPGGAMYVAWTGYRGGANEVWLRSLRAGTWSAPERVLERPGDVFLVQLGRDRKDRLWAVWSQQLNGNWDLYGRSLDAGKWSKTERLTTDPQPDVYHRLANAPDGTLWLVWQGFRSGKSDIFARRLDGTSWSAAERVSDSPANDWEPAVAIDRAGGVHVVWDTYARGNYDIRMRTWRNGTWDAPLAVADSPKFEAHPTVACDAKGRVWIAWNESGFHWGKDTGFLLRKQATSLYQSRWIGLAVRDGAEWKEPADVNQALPTPARDYNDYPSLAADGTGRIWLFFRHRNVKFRGVHPEAPSHRAAWEIHGVAFDGSAWTQPVDLPFSAGRQDMRWAVAPNAEGNLVAAWPTDGRDFDEYLFSHSDVHAGLVPAPPAAKGEPTLRRRPSLTYEDFPSHASEPEDLKKVRAYTINSGGSTYRIVRGDTHRHTEFSMDGNNDGSLQQTYRYALDAASLDFLGVSEHNGNGGPDVEYVNWLLQQMADVFHLPGGFAPLYGYERSLSYPNGHRNVMFAKRGNPTLPIPPEEQKAQTGAKGLYEYLRRLGGIAISHTSASTMGTDWRDNDPEVEPLVEIYQGDRVSAEYEGAPKAANAADPASAPGGFRPAGYVWNAWAKGYKLGVQASSDHLSTHISYACTLVTDFTREGLLDAMRRRHSYAATDNIVLDYRLEIGGREYLQGDIAQAAGDARLRVKILGTKAVRQIDVIRNNRFVHALHPMKQEVEFTYADRDERSASTYYYVRVVQVDDQMAWSSPIWVAR